MLGEDETLLAQLTTRRHQRVLTLDVEEPGGQLVGIAQLAALMPRTAGVRRWGTASLDLAYVAAGRFDGFWERGLHAWDVAAGSLLVREAGGFVGTIEGEGSPVDDRSIVAANANVFETLRSALREA